MDLPESIVAEYLENIIRRSALRLEQERLHVAELSPGSRQHSSAVTALADGAATLDKLKAYRAKFD